MQHGKCNGTDCRCCIFEARETDQRLCECGHKRNFHLGPSTQLSRESLAGTKSVSDMVAPVFEKEVNLHLTQNLPSCLSRCSISDMRNRQIEDDRDGTMLLEIDSFGYMYDDSCNDGKEMKTSGIFLIAPENCALKRSAKAVEKPSGSPEAIARKLDKTAEKYIIGESYSGQSGYTVREKVATLEDRVKKMKERYSEKHSSKAAEDVTCAVGAVLLCFSAGPMQRNHAKTYFNDVICESMSMQATPLLWRMAEARRLFLVVLSDTENPQATAFREIAAQGQSQQLQLDEMGQNIDEMGQNIDEMGQNIDEMGQNINDMGQELGQKLETVLDLLKDHMKNKKTTRRASTKESSKPQSETHSL